MILKELPRQQQLEYTEKLLYLLKDMQNPTHTSNWADVIALRQVYSLTSYNKDQLRRSIILKELIDAGTIVTAEFADNPVHIVDIDTGETKEAPYGTFSRSYDSTTQKQISEAVLPFTEEELASPESIVKAHKFDPDNFELIKVRNTLYQQGNKNGTKNLYSSKIEVKPKENFYNLTLEDYKNMFEELIKIKDETLKNNKKFIPNYSNYEYDSNLLVVCLSDLHLGRNSVFDEVGQSNNLEKNIEDIKNSVCNYICKFQDMNIEKIILPIGNDLMNSTFTGKTYHSGNYQDNSTTTREIFKKSTECMIWVIEQFAKLAPVTVTLVTGNHDLYEEYALSLVLSAYFKDDYRIEVDTSSQPRKYYKYGNILLAFSHGQMDKKRLETILFSEAKNLITENTKVYWILGHIHTLTCEERGDIEIWTTPSPASLDNWTKENGYNNKRRSMAFVFDKNEMTQTYFVSL